MSLSKMLQEYREGLRGLPTYEELAVIAAPALDQIIDGMYAEAATTFNIPECMLRAPVPPAIFQPVKQNEHLARAVQAILKAAPQGIADERPAFEAWIVSAFDECGEDEPNLTLDENGRYTNDMRVLTSWQVWQARAVLPTQNSSATPCADSIVERNVSLLRERSTVGVQKYGMTVADNKLPLRAWLNHALEEALDQANYLQAAMAEIDSAERALPPLPQYFPDVTNIRADEELRAQQYAQDYARSALASAPVHAQEQIAYTAGSLDIFDLIREWAHKPEGNRYEAARKIIGYINSTYTAGVNDGKFLGATAAPEQPMAVPGDLDMQTIRERDYNAEMADKLAEAISKHFGIDIGEHSNMNCPWHEALEAIENATPVMWAALNMNGKVVCVNQDKSACDVERLCIKTPTTIAPLYAGASEP